MTVYQSCNSKSCSSTGCVQEHSCRLAMEEPSTRANVPPRYDQTKAHLHFPFICAHSMMSISTCKLVILFYLTISCHERLVLFGFSGFLVRFCLQCFTEAELVGHHLGVVIFTGWLLPGNTGLICNA